MLKLLHRPWLVPLSYPLSATGALVRRTDHQQQVAGNIGQPQATKTLCQATKVGNREGASIGLSKDVRAWQEHEMPAAGSVVHSCQTKSRIRECVLQHIWPAEASRVLTALRMSVSLFQVGDAFEGLLSFPTGSVVAVWKDCPPYIIPDLSFGLFVAFTTFAMTFRYIPRFDSRTSVTLRHMLLASLVLLGLWMSVGWVLYRAVSH